LARQANGVAKRARSLYAAASVQAPKPVATPTPVAEPSCDEVPMQLLPLRLPLPLFKKNLHIDVPDFLPGSKEFRKPSCTVVKYLEQK
jgi:hypothetical protein